LGQPSAAWEAGMTGTGRDGRRAKSPRLRRGLALALLVAFCAPASADYRITRDHGGEIKSYEAKYAHLRDQGERIVIDGICNSACTMVLGIVPSNRICVTPRASLGFHLAYFDQRWTAGIKITSYAGTEELMGFYPASVKDWIARHGGLTTKMKHLTNGPELWMLVDPCPDDF